MAFFANTQDISEKRFADKIDKTRQRKGKNRLFYYYLRSIVEQLFMNERRGIFFPRPISVATALIFSCPLNLSRLLVRDNALYKKQERQRRLSNWSVSAPTMPTLSQNWPYHSYFTFFFTLRIFNNGDLRYFIFSKVHFLLRFFFFKQNARTERRHGLTRGYELYKRYLIYRYRFKKH